ncbi:hypothetical protein Moror_4429 [Moniliophthora roreri MCA 2997]|uniref:DUF6533 domain-containing protein n=1 Tax=Moniliophthora roreri (strain MCA 2997) TaxID=1381753 RepID=V2XI44_MONRO|nr:hypothetical protein Moror_4429 [Moniliophthora roreri MCA 2997]
MSMPSMSAITDAAFKFQIVSYFHVISVALLFYDYILTISMEINYVWTSPFNAMKVLFVLQRYMPFFDTAGLVLLRQFAPNPGDRTCLVYYMTSGWMFSASMAFSEIILAARAWAVSGRQKFFTVLLPAFFVVCWLPSIVIQHLFYKGVRFGQSPIPHLDDVGCFVIAADSYSWICWVLLMVYEAGLLILMVISCVKNHYSGGRSALSKIVYRDGILYFVYLFGLSLTNVVVILTAPGILIDLLGPLERVMYSVLTSRVILHIREHADSRRQAEEVVALYPSQPPLVSSALYTQQLQEGVLVSQLPDAEG